MQTYSDHVLTVWEKSYISYKYVTFTEFYQLKTFTKPKQKFKAHVSQT